VGKNSLAHVLDDLVLIPSVVPRLDARGIEAHGRIRPRAAAFERLVTDKLSLHGETLRAHRGMVNPVLEKSQHCIRTCRSVMDAASPPRLYPGSSSPIWAAFLNS